VAGNTGDAALLLLSIGFPVFSTSDFNWAPFYVDVFFTLRIIISDLGQILLAPALQERNYCLCRGAFERRFMTTLSLGCGGEGRKF